MIITYFCYYFDQIENFEARHRDTENKLSTTHSALKKIELDHAKLQANHHQLKKEFHLVSYVEYIVYNVHVLISVHFWLYNTTARVCV